MFHRLILLGVLCASQATAQDPLVATVDRLAPDILKTSKAPGMSVVLVRNDTVLLARGYGRRSSMGPELVDEKTLFVIGGLTKGVTAAALAVLVDDGKLQWDDPVKKHLPNFRLSDPWVGDHVTVRDLLLSRFGIPRSDTAIKPNRSAEDIMARAAAMTPLHFRDNFGESGNLDFFLASEVAAAVSHQTWADLVRARLLVPLGMNSTTPKLSVVEASSNFARSHTVRNDSLILLGPQDLEYMSGAAALYSNAVDMSALLRLYLAGGRFAGRQVISETAMREMRTPLVVSSVGNFRGFFNRYASVIGFGMGWHVSDYRGHTVIENGSTFGSFQYMLMMPEEHFGMVVLANVGPALPIWNPVQDMKFALLDQVLGPNASPVRKSQ